MAGRRFDLWRGMVNWGLQLNRIRDLRAGSLLWGRTLRNRNRIDLNFIAPIGSF